MNPRLHVDHYEEDETQPVPGLWSRVKRQFGVAEKEEFEEEEPATDSRGKTIRLHTARTVTVSVRLHASEFGDAQIAADGLKAGQQQILNLEEATPQMSERIIDFLNGVVYALDGSVERVGERVYLFAPANVIVDVDDGSRDREEF